MILDFAKKLLWYPPYPIRKPLLLLRKWYESRYDRWLKNVYPRYCVERFEFENRTLPPDAPGISLLTLVFQPRPSHFQKCAESVLAQTLPSFEWVIVNNGSGSSRVLQLLRVLRAHPGIKIITPEQNLGIAKGTSLAAQKATGVWLAFLDHDDILDPGALMDVAKVASFRPDIEFIYSDSDHCDEVGRRHTPLVKAGPSPEYILGTNYICHFHAIRKTLFQEIHRGVSELDGSQDWEISMRALDNPHRVYHCPKILYTQRVHPNQFSSNFYRAKHCRAKEQISRSQREILESHLMRRGLGMSYEIEELPARGCYYIRYAGKKEPAVTVFVPIRQDERSIDPLKQSTNYNHYVVKPLAPGEDFAGAISGVCTPYVAWCDPGIKIQTPQWLSQSIGLMERESGVAFVSGKILGSRQVFPHPNPKALPPGVSFGADLRREVTHLAPHWWAGRTEVCKIIPTTRWIVERGPHRAAMHAPGLRVVHDPTLLGVWNDLQ